MRIDPPASLLSRMAGGLVPLVDIVFARSLRQRSSRVCRSGVNAVIPFGCRLSMIAMIRSHSAVFSAYEVPGATCEPLPLDVAVSVVEAVSVLAGGAIFDVDAVVWLLSTIPSGMLSGLVTLSSELCGAAVSIVAATVASDMTADSLSVVAAVLVMVGAEHVAV